MSSRSAAPKSRFRSKTAKAAIFFTLLSGISATSSMSPAKALAPSAAVQVAPAHTGLAPIAPAVRGFKAVSIYPQVISFPSPTYMSALTTTFIPATVDTKARLYYGIAEEGTAGCSFDLVQPYVHALRAGSCKLAIVSLAFGQYAETTFLADIIFTATPPQLTLTSDASHVATTNTVDLSASSVVGNLRYQYAASELTTTIDASSASICSASGNVITTIRNGTCLYSVSVLEHGLASAASKTGSFQVTTMKTQVITYPDSLDVTVTNYRSLPVATTNSPTTLVYRLVDAGTAQCSIIATAPYFGAHNPGTCTIAIDAPGAAGWTPATKTVPITLTAIAPTLTISVDKSAASTTGQAKVLVQGYDTSAIHLTTAPESAGVCSATGNIITGYSNGFCAMTLDVNANGFFTAYSKAYSVAVDWTQPQIINSPDSYTVSYPNTSVETATASGGGNPTFRVLDPGTAGCYLATTQPLIRANQPGNCSVGVDAPSAPGWQATTKVVSFTFIQVAPTISAAYDKSRAAAAGLVTVNITKNTAAPAVITIAAGSESICSVSGFTLATYANGTCSFTVSVASNGFYTAATKAFSLNVTWVRRQVITFAASLSLTVLDTTTGVATTNSNNPVTYSIQDAGTAQCSISTVQPFVRALHPGNCSMRIDVAATAGWSSASKVVPVTFTSVDPTLNISLDTSTVASTGFAAIAVEGYQAGDITVTADSGFESVCSGAGNKIAAYKNENCGYTVHVAPIGLFNELTVSRSTLVDWVRTPVLSYTASTTVDGYTSYLTRPASTSGGRTFTYTVVDPVDTAKCSVESATGALHLTQLGTCTVRIDSPASPGWMPSSVTVILNIVAAIPVLQLFNDDSNSWTTKYGVLSVSGYTNAQITSLSVVDMGSATCSISGFKLYGIRSGYCTIRVTSAPTGIWLAGDSVSTKGVTWWGFREHIDANP